MKYAIAIFGIFLVSWQSLLHAEDDHQPVKIYVSQLGHDQWSGEIAAPNANGTDGPLATLHAAQKKVRSILGDQTTAIEVVIRGGIYQLENPLVLEPQDSGKQEMPVVWTSYPGERVIVSGGKRISDWKRVTEDVPGLPPNAVGAVWYTDLEKGTTFYSLFDDLGLLPQAIPGKFYTDNRSQEVQTTRTMTWRDDDLANLSQTSEAILHILPTYAFVYNVLRVDSINEANKTLTVKNPTGFRLHASKLPNPNFQTYYRIANVIEHLDQPGEWVIHAKQGRLYYWPIKGNQPGEDVCYPVMDELVSLRGDVENKEWVRNIVLRGLVLRNTERMLDASDTVHLMAQWDVFEGRNGVVRMKGAQHVTIENCVIENAGGCGIKSGIYSANNTFRNNIVRNMGHGGISLIGHGPGNIADNNHNVVSHNIISHCGEIHACGIGLLLCGSAYNHVHNNLIHHTANHGIAMIGDGKFPLEPSDDATKDARVRRMAVQKPYTRWRDFKIPAEDDTWYHRQSYVHTNSNMVEYNEIHHAAHGDRMSDVNSLYSHATGRGNVYRRNYVHDMHGAGTNCAYRSDDWMWFFRVYENVIRDIRGPAFNIKQVNEFVNNVVIDCDDVCFNFKTDWTPPGQTPLDEPHHGTTVRRNIMVQRSRMITGKNSRIPAFYDAQDDDLLTHPLIENNLLFCPDDPSIADAALAQARALGHDRYSVAADPMFVDPDNGDFRFKEGSPALRLGIKPLTEYGVQDLAGLQVEYGHLDPGGSVKAERVARRMRNESSPQNHKENRDLILSATAPMSITPDGKIEIVAKYNVSESRDIYVVFVKSGKKYGGVRKTVDSGRGDIKLSLSLNEYPDKVGDGFTFVVMVLPVDKTWKEALHLHRITGVIVR
ncbi:MAG: right-handed parallel beta-helix repeat-containing protein [Planctomycetota bacterium]